MPVWLRGPRIRFQARRLSVGLQMPSDVPLQGGADMPEWKLQISDATCRPLKDFVRHRGGTRLALHGGLRDRLVEMAVEEFPGADCPLDRVEEVLRARMNIRIRREHGSVVAMILIGVLVNVIVRLVTEWWFQKRSHRVLMEGWSYALASARVQVKAAPKA